MEALRIRPASEKDAGAISEIYGWYVEHTAITFEYDIPSEAEMRTRIVHTLQRYPYLVIEENGSVVGYAYADSYYDRAAYDRCCEMSIYLRRDCRGKGYGRMLYSAIENILGRMGILNLYACIAVPEVPDNTLDDSSVQFHTRLGYREIGRFVNCGYKFGRWYHTVWMEKNLGVHAPEPQPVILWPQLQKNMKF